MTLVLTEEETLLVDSVRALLTRAAPVSKFRALRDSGDPRQYDPELWRALAESGFAAPQIPENAGGIGMGYAAAGLIAEEMGRVLAASPFHSTALAAEALLGSSHVDALVPLITGESIVAVAIDEGARHAPTVIATRAERDGDGFRISGTKRRVIDGGIADAFIVAAMTDAGLSLFQVPGNAPGVEKRALNQLDSRNAIDLTLDNVVVGATALIGAADEAPDRIARMLDVGNVLIACELLGIAQEAFDRTVAYLKEREQFGHKIGSFQALQHRASRMFCALELARGVALKALRALDDADPATTQLASLAKAVLTKTSREVLNEALQMHGGIGVTDDLDIGLFFKRARAAGDWLGDDYYHRERLAKIAWGM
jgi:alkylation response protein AidB-like acyl-CoA dehydrogenase